MSDDGTGRFRSGESYLLCSDKLQVHITNVAYNNAIGIIKDHLGRKFNAEYKATDGCCVKVTDVDGADVDESDGRFDIDLGKTKKIVEH